MLDSEPCLNETRLKQFFKISLFLNLKSMFLETVCVSSAIRKQRQKNQALKDSLGYVANSKPLWAIRDSDSKKKKK